MTTSGMAMMKTGNNVPRVGIEATPLAFGTITPPRLSDITAIPTPTCRCGSVLEKSVQTTYYKDYMHLIKYVLCVYCYGAHLTRYCSL